MRYLLVMFVTAVSFAMLSEYTIQFPKVQRFTNQVLLVNFAV